MPYLNITVKDARSPAREFADFLRYIYGDEAYIEWEKPGEAQIFVNVPGSMKRAEFDSDVQEWCEEHGCSYKLIDQAPEAPSRQYFSENTKLMYPKAKDYEALKKTPKRLQTAKNLWKKNWNTEFDENQEEDREDIVILYNMYMEELAEWKPVVLQLSWNEEKETKEEN